MTSNYFFVTSFNEFVINGYSLVEEARENPNIHKSHVNFVEETIDDMVNVLENILETEILDQEQFKEYINEKISKIDYQCRKAQEAKVENTFRFYSSVLDVWNEFVHLIHEEDEEIDSEQNYELA